LVETAYFVHDVFVVGGQLEDVPGDVFKEECFEVLLRVGWDLVLLIVQFRLTIVVSFIDGFFIFPLFP
jgi:hypothetical protein